MGKCYQPPFNIQSQQLGGWERRGSRVWGEDSFSKIYCQKAPPPLPSPLSCLGLTSERHDSFYNVSVKSKLQHHPQGQPPGHLTFLKIIVQIPPYPGQNAVQMPPPWGHFTGTKMTEERRKRLQLSNKIFINITKTEQHC